MNTKKIAGLFSIAMLALVIGGVAYSHWTESITVDGTVNTGFIDVGLSAKVYMDNENDKSGEPHYYQEVATAKVEILDPVLSAGAVKNVKITIDNAYPSLDVIVIFDLKNYGTVPVGLYEYLRYPGLDPDWDVAIKQMGQGWYTEDVNQATPCQLDPWRWRDVEVQYPNVWYWWWHLHVEEEAIPGETYTFYATAEFWNWNEIETGADCLDLGGPGNPPDLSGYYLAGDTPAYYYPT